MKTFLTILKKYSIFIILLIVFAYGIFCVDLFVKPRNLYNLMLNTCLYGIPAIGMTFIMLTGNIDLSIGRLVALCAIVACMTASKIGFIPGVIITLLVGMAISYITSNIITRFRIDPLITTLGIQVIIEGFSLIICKDQTMKNTNEVLRGLFGYKLFGILPMPLILFGVLLALSLFVTRSTKFGLNIYVAGGNKEAGKLSGIDIGKLQRMCWVVAGACAAIGGIVLASRVNSGSTILGNTLNLTTIASCVVGGISFSGGKGNHLRMVAGVLVMQSLSNIMALKGMVGSAQTMITGLVLVGVLILDRYTQYSKKKL